MLVPTFQLSDYETQFKIIVNLAQQPMEIFRNTPVEVQGFSKLVIWQNTG